MSLTQMIRVLNDWRFWRFAITNAEINIHNVIQLIKTSSVLFILSLSFSYFTRRG